MTPVEEQNKQSRNGASSTVIPTALMTLETFCLLIHKTYPDGVLCIFSDRRPGTGPVIPVPLMWYSAEPIVWAQSFPSNSVAATTTSTVPEVVETRLRESAAQIVRSDESNTLSNLPCHPWIHINALLKKNDSFQLHLTWWWTLSWSRRRPT